MFKKNIIQHVPKMSVSYFFEKYRAHISVSCRICVPCPYPYFIGVKYGSYFRPPNVQVHEIMKLEWHPNKIYA